MTTILYLLAVALVSGVVWAVMLAYEWWRTRGTRSRVSDGLLRDYHREAMREAAPQYVCWPTPEQRAERGKL